MTQKTNPWTFDVRVRERNLKAGTVTEKDVDKYLAGLPDLADQSEPFATSQPALAQPIVEEPEEQDEDEEDEEVMAQDVAQPVAAQPAVAQPVMAQPAAQPEADTTATPMATSDEPQSSPE